MQEQRVEFAQRHEDESALVHSRMRHYKILLVDHPLAVEQNVQIDGSGPRSILLIPAERSLDLPEDGQEALRRDTCLKLHDAVQEPPVPRLGMVFDWLSFIEQRHAQGLGVRQQAEQGHCTIAEIDPIPDVRAKPDEHRLAPHLFLLSLQG